MLRSNRTQRGERRFAAALGTLLAVVICGLLMGRAAAMAGGNILKDSLTSDSAIFWKASDAGEDAWQKTDGSSPVPKDAQLRLRLAFKISPEHLKDGTTFAYTLPQGLSLPDTASGTSLVVFDGKTASSASEKAAKSAGTARIDGNVLTVTLEGADATKEASCFVDLDFSFDMLALDSEGAVKLVLNGSISCSVVRAAVQKEEPAAPAAAATEAVPDETQSAEAPAEAKTAPASEESSTETIKTPADDEDVQTDAADQAPLPAAFRAPVLRGANSAAVDLTPYLKSVSVKKKQGKTYVDATEFTDGDQVQTHISYQIESGKITPDARTATYQIPNGLRPNQELSGTMMNGDKETGTYTISTKGLITLYFNEETASDGGAISGDIQFTGTVSNDGDGDKTTIDFGGSAGSITVKKNHDIAVNKVGTLSEDNTRIDYTVTVSTTKGTSGTVDFSDYLNKYDQSNANPSYDKNSFHLKKISSNEPEQDLTSQYPPQWNDGADSGPAFSISSLPQLAPGEKYVMTYSALVGATDKAAGATVSNRAYATDGNNHNNSYVRTTYEPDVSKSGTYDSATNHVIWTIAVNPNGKDISNWTVVDNLPAGTKLTQPYTVRSADNSISQSFGNAGETRVNFKFSDLGSLSDAQKTQKYYIDIYTDAPSGNTTLSNTARATTPTGNVDAVGTVQVTHRTTKVEKTHGGDARDDSRGTGIRKETWSSRITLPEGNLSTFTYTDTIGPAKVGSKDLGPDSHFSTAAELDEAFRSSVSGSSVTSQGKLKLEVDPYTSYLYTGNGTAFYDSYYADEDGTKQGVSFTVTYYDKDGKVVDAGDATTPVTSFTVKVGIADGQTVTAQDMQIGPYPTYMDTSKAAEGDTVAVSNKGSVGDASSEPEFTYTKPNRIQKEIKTGDHTYTKGDATLQLGNLQDGKMTYRISLSMEPADDGHDISVTDALPSGMTYVDGSVTARYGEWYDDQTFTGDKAPRATSVPTDAGTKLTFTIPSYKYEAGKTTLYLYYDVSIKSDPSWNKGTTEKTYSNTAQWNKSSSTQKTAVKRENEVVSKGGEQLYAAGQPTNNLRYYVEINPSGTDLDPNSDELTLTDTLNPNGIESALDPSSIRLYAYDYTKEHSYDPGREIRIYSTSYDKTTHTMTVKVPDGTPCVLVYDYMLDNSFAEGATISNSASLNGRTAKESSISLKEASSSATTHKARLVLYKVDASDFRKPLPGAEFKLWSWDGSSWKEQATNKPLVTDSNGSIQYDYESNVDGLNTDTLYRLSETKAPVGYAGTSEQLAEHFFIVKGAQSVESDDTAFANAGAGNAKKKTGDSLQVSDVDFFKDNATGTMYVTNEYTRLTVQKSWTDEEGVEMKKAPEGSSVTLQLYSSSKKTDPDDAVKLSVRGEGEDQSNPYNRPVVYLDGTQEPKDVKKGSKFVFQVHGWNIKYRVLVNGQQQGEYKNDNVENTSITLDSVASNTGVVDVVVQLEGSQSAPGSITTETWTAPREVIDDSTSTAVGEQVTLDDSKGWSKSWDDLPKQDSQGHDIYYTVKELSYTVGNTSYDAGAGAYNVSYTNDDGIQTGTITVTNAAKESQGYELPETGGAGTGLPVAAGAALTAFAAAGLILLRKVGAKRRR
ncbi:MAG: SpaA isopeptide-forming pilin-related protein [Atopobiaceae bacterium]